VEEQICSRFMASGLAVFLSAITSATPRLEVLLAPFVWCRTGRWRSSLPFLPHLGTLELGHGGSLVPQRVSRLLQRRQDQDRKTLHGKPILVPVRSQS